jgi:uncharacterized membrane protein YfcA
MKHLSPPSPEVRAAIKMMGITGIILGAQAVVYFLSRFFNSEEIVQGMALTLLAVAIYMIFQMFVDQERHKDALNQRGQQ